MNLYDEIKSPFNDIEILRSIIDIYVNHRCDGGSRPIENGDDFTDGVTKYGERDKYSQDEYIVQFNKYIRMPNFDRLYKSISNPEFVSNLDEFVAKRINEIKSMRISDEEKKGRLKN